MNLQNYTSEFRYNLKLAYPVMLGMIGHTLVSLVDNIMVGQLGTAELAAVSLGNSFVFIAMSLGIGFSTAITPLVAEADGEKNIEKGKQAFNHGMAVAGSRTRQKCYHNYYSQIDIVLWPPHRWLGNDHSLD